MVSPTMPLTSMAVFPRPKARKISAAAQGVKTLNDQGAGNIVSVAAEQIHQHGADTGRRRTVPGPQQPTGEQHEAVAQIHIAVDGGRDLNDAGSHIDKGGHQSTEN